MIKYKLLCKNCSDSFESWFASSKEFERLKKSKLLQCLNCNSNKIDKSLMAPSIINKQKKNNKDTKNNFDYVGDNFAYEARSIHYNNKKKQKGIYGKSSIKEVKELSEEGIEVETVPWINDKEN